MKALTLHQPWAQLVAEGVKTVETRPWRTDYRGPLVVHAGKARPLSVPIVVRMAAAKYEMRYGAVVASCRLVDVVPITDGANGAVGKRVLQHHRDPPVALLDDDPWANPNTGDYTDQLPFGDFSPGRYAWLLADVAPTTTRCPWCQPYTNDPIGGAGSLPVLSSAKACPVCKGEGRCDPIPARGRQGLWDWSGT